MGICLESYVISMLLAFIVIFLLSFRFYNKYIAPYSVFPTSWVLFKALPRVITENILKNTTGSSLIMQIFLNDCKKIMSKGYCVFWIPKPYLMIFNEEAVKIISNEQTAINKSEKYENLSYLSGLVISKGDVWRKHRKVLQPIFNVSSLKNYVPVFNKHAAMLVQQLLIVTYEPVEIIHYLRMCSLDDVLETIVGIKSEDSDEQEKEKFIEIIDKNNELFSRMIMNPLLISKRLSFFSSTVRQHKKGINEAKAMTKKLLLKMKNIPEAQEAVAEDEEFYRPPRKSFAELQSHLQDPSFNVDDKANEANTFFSQAFDTVSHTTMWCLFLLANHQEVQDQVYNEVECLIGKGEYLSYEDTQALTYMECVIKETLRLYPTVPIYGRLLEEDIQCGKYNIPQGTNVIFCPYLLHRNPEVYPNPEKFDPERFRGNLKNPWSYTPFAEGIRNCIGKKFALIEMKIMLGHILQAFKVTALKDVEDIQLGWQITLVPNQPIKLCFKPRHST